MSWLEAPAFGVMLNYLTTLFGATAMYVFSLNNGFQGSVPFLRNVFPGKKNVFYYRFDFLIVSLSGSLIGTLFFSPTTPLQGLAAGFGWVGALNVLLNPQSAGGNPQTASGKPQALAASQPTDRASPEIADVNEGTAGGQPVPASASEQAEGRRPQLGTTDLPVAKQDPPTKGGV